MAQRWERVREAFEVAYRIMDEEKIPHGLPTCRACSKALSEGDVRFFHADCDEQRFTNSVDLRPLKDYARSHLREGGTLRDVILALDDKLPKVELGVLAQLITRLRT